jgi:MFS family permease
VDDGSAPAHAPYAASVDLAGYLGTVTAMVTLALVAMAIVAGRLGRRIDDLGAVGDLGRRVARLESHG